MYDRLDAPFPSIPHPFDFGNGSQWLQETWKCVCGARHLGQRRIVEPVKNPWNDRMTSLHAPAQN